MQNSGYPYKHLCQAIEDVLRHEVSTPKDFDDLHERIFSRTHVLISPTTLKRVWGYVNYEYAPSLRTLNTLAQFLGHHDYKQFCEQPASPDGSPSKIVISNYLDVQEDLVADDELTLYWLPDRECQNTFCCQLIIEGEPLYLSQLRQGDRPLVNYVCGKHGGIRFIEKRKI